MYILLMILINSVILFMTRLYSIKLYTKNYLKSNDYISNVIKNSSHNLINNTKNNYYYNSKENIFKKNEHNTLDGLDMRENITDNITDNISLFNISVLLYKKTLLDILNNDGININNKLSHIEEYNKIFNENKCYNIYEGLMKDWDF